MAPSQESSKHPSHSPVLALLGKTFKAVTRAIGEILSGPGATGRIAP